MTPPSTRPTLRRGHAWGLMVRSSIVGMRVTSVRSGAQLPWLPLVKVGDTFGLGDLLGQLQVSPPSTLAGLWLLPDVVRTPVDAAAWVLQAERQAPTRLWVRQLDLRQRDRLVVQVVVIPDRRRPTP